MPGRWKSGPSSPPGKTTPEQTYNRRPSVKYVNLNEDIVIEVDEDRLRAEAINLKDLAAQIEGLERALTEFPELSDEDLLAWARAQKYPLERLMLRETMAKEIERLRLRLEELSPKEKGGEELAARVVEWR
jgi:hypothetical protein